MRNRQSIITLVTMCTVLVSIFMLLRVTYAEIQAYKMKVPGGMLTCDLSVLGDFVDASIANDKMKKRASEELE